MNGPFSEGLSLGQHLLHIRRHLALARPPTGGVRHEGHACICLVHTCTATYRIVLLPALLAARLNPLYTIVRCAGLVPRKLSSGWTPSFVCLFSDCVSHCRGLFAISVYCHHQYVWLFGLQSSQISQKPAKLCPHPAATGGITNIDLYRHI